MKTRNDPLGALDAYIHAGLQEWEIPGLAVAIVKDGVLAYAKGFGVRQLVHNEPVTENTVFAIASNTKAFTATALGLLVQEEKLSWDDRVIDHLPGFQLYDPYVTREITVRDLLCHRSGLPTWGGDLLSYGSNYTRDEILRRVRHIPPAFSFRSGFGYANLMFLAAGQIIPALTQTRWEDFVRERLLQPLGMAHSHTSVRDLAGLSDVATPHIKRDGRIVPVPYRNRDANPAAGAINSTVTDMARWLRLQLGLGTLDGKWLVDPAIIAETRTPQTLIPIAPAERELFPSRHFFAYGLGWSLMDYHGRLVVWHTGGIDGMASVSGFLPEENLGAVILTNLLPNQFPKALFYHIVDAYLGLPYQDWSERLLAAQREELARQEEQERRMERARIPGTRPSLPTGVYAGAYTNPIYGAATIAEEDGTLILQLMAHPAITGRLEHWHHDTFLCQWTDPVFDRSFIPFSLNSQGQVEGFRVKVREDWIDPLEYVFTRVSPPAD